MDELDEVPDLRPSPWPVHGVIVVAMMIAYVVLAIGAWPTEAAPAGDKLQQGLGVLVGIGQAAAAGAIVMGGACLMFYAALSTALVGRFRNPWLVHGVAFALGGIAIAVGHV